MKIISVERRWHGVFPMTAKRPSVGCSSHTPVWPGGTQNVMVAVEPSASVPVSIAVQPSVRLMIHVPALVCSLICVAVNPITVPVSVLFPAGGRGVGRGRGVGVGLAAGVVVVVVVGVQLTRSVAPARMQM